MYRRPKFLEVLLDIRREMAREAGYDVELFAEIARTGNPNAKPRQRPAVRMMAEPEIQKAKIPKLARSREA